MDKDIHLSGYDSERFCDRFEAFIFDVDGTLYNQLPVRIVMACRLIVDVILHPFHLNMAVGVLRFRKIREENTYKVYSMEQQIEHIANKFNLRLADFKRYIDMRMFQEPLRYIQIFRYTDVIAFISECKSRGKEVVIYSDYPAKEKAEVLSIQYDLLFYPGHGIANEMKPSTRGINTIIDSLRVSNDKILYVGDRYDTDGEAARKGKMEYMDIKKLRKILKRERQGIRMSKY